MLEKKFDPKKPRIFLDLDDVLCDWAGETLKLHNINLENPAVFSLVTSSWGMGKILDEPKMWESIHKIGSDFWANLPFLPWGQLLYQRLAEEYPVCLLTSPSNHPSCGAGKMEWIQKYLGTRNFLIGKNKEWCANPYSVLIDDRPENIEKFVAAGGHGYLWPSSLLLRQNDLWLEEINNLRAWLWRHEDRFGGTETFCHKK